MSERRGPYETALASLDLMGVEATRLMELLTTETLASMAEVYRAAGLVASAYHRERARRVELSAEVRRLTVELEAAQARIVALLRDLAEARAGRGQKGEDSGEGETIF